MTTVHDLRSVVGTGCNPTLAPEVASTIYRCTAHGSPTSSAPGDATHIYIYIERCMGGLTQHASKRRSFHVYLHPTYQTCGPLPVCECIPSTGESRSDT